MRSGAGPDPDAVVTVRYLPLLSGSRLDPPEGWDSYKCLLLLARVARADEVDRICASLVGSGCAYAMTWGIDCERWHDAIDDAHLGRFEDTVPEDATVLTTWHSDETLGDVLWFAMHTATSLYAGVPLNRLLIADLCTRDREEEILSLARAIGGEA